VVIADETLLRGDVAIDKTACLSLVRYRYMIALCRYQSVSRWASATSEASQGWGFETAKHR